MRSSARPTGAATTAVGGIVGALVVAALVTCGAASTPAPFDWLSITSNPPAAPAERSAGSP